MSTLRVLSHAGLALSATAALLLGGCGSSTVTAPALTTSPPKTGIDFYTIGVTVVNDTGNCAWITPYWANTLTPWHIFNGDDIHPHWLDAGKRASWQYLIIPKNPIAPAVQIKVLAEVQRGPGCNGGTSESPVGIYKDFTPREGVLDACARLKYNGSFYVTEPRQTQDCN